MRSSDQDSNRGRASDSILRLTRRNLLRGMAGTAGFLALGASRLDALQDNLPALPNPASSGLEHIVVVMMENRSFDHFLGWLPGADGKQAGLTYQDQLGVSHATHSLAPDYQGCAHPDPDHSYTGGRVEYDNGECDGWLRAGQNDDYAIGYYAQQDLSFLGQQAPQWTAFDRYFAAIMAETFPNRIYQHAAQTDRLDNSTTISTLPTIWDRLAKAGVSGRYYFNDVPVLALWGNKYISISRPFTSFLIDCITGNLPQVAFVDPRFIDENSGTSADDHPHADIRNGEAFLDVIYKAVTLSPGWRNTALVINYDEWGGFFDHVPPPIREPIPKADRHLGSDGRLGFRVPSLLISPWSQRRRVFSGGPYDHTSVLKLIEWRWDLKPLTVRDETANNLGEVLDFGARNLRAPQFLVPLGPFGAPCPPTPPAAPLAPLTAGDHWTALRESARSSGWPV